MVLYEHAFEKIDFQIAKASTTNNKSEIENLNYTPNSQAQKRKRRNSLTDISDVVNNPKVLKTLPETTDQANCDLTLSVMQTLM